MNNPFLGMNPWLEGEDWHDFHTIFAAEISNYLIAQIAPKYKVFVEKYVVREEIASGEVSIYYSDVGISDNKAEEPLAMYGKSEPLTAHDLVISASLPAERKIPFVKITDAKNREIITVIKMLSPANKMGEGYLQYQEKREKLLRTPVHLLEIDLLRRGKRTITHPKVKASDYLVALTKKEEKQTLLWLFDALQPLPTLPIPLRKKDAPAILNLQTIFTDIFSKRQYGSYFDYQDKAPAPVLKLAVRQHLDKWLAEEI